MSRAIRYRNSFLVMFIVLIFAPLLAFAQANPIADICPFEWTRNLKFGSVGSDVTNLQKFLNNDADTIVALSGAGSSGNETQVYGPATRRAVIKFQEKYASDILAPNGLTKGTGITGVSTRAKLNGLCVEAPAPAPSDQGSLENAAVVASALTQVDKLTIEDPGQPASSIAPASAGVLFLTFNLIAEKSDVTVREVTIERIGLGADAAFLSFGLYDEQGLQIGNVVSLNSSHRATFRTPFKIPAGETKYFEVYANMQADLTDYDAQMPAIQIVNIAANSPVEGDLPLRGSSQTINNSLVVGGATATLSQYDPFGATTHYITDKDIRFSGIRISANSQEDITLWNIIWTQAGSAGNTDVANITTVVNGVSYPTVISPYSEKEYVSFFDPGIVIAKGDAVDVYVKGDFTTTGAGRTVEFDIRDINDEVSLSGNQYGFGLGLSPAANTDVAGAHSAFLTSDGTTDGDTVMPFFSGSITTISAGVFGTIEKR
ncbi:MAG TPA: peptidoglycan-binding domain-containing protein [Candidatus Paceibacterota bacterium]